MYRQIDRTDTVWAEFPATTDPMMDPYEVLIDRVQQLDLELQTVNIELESTSEQLRRVGRQNTLILESLPIGAMLIDRTGFIRMVNRKAQELLHLENQSCKGILVDRVWAARGFPTVPCAEWEYQGRTLKCWETVMDEPGSPSGESIRFIQEVHHEQPQTHQEGLLALGEMVGHIAHEIRNPLGSIELFANMLGQRLQDYKERQTLSAHLSTSVRALDQVLSNVLAFANPQHARMREISIRSLLDEVEVLACQKLRAHRITIKRMIDEDAELIQADGVRLRQVCLNLLLNAIQASPEGGIIEVDCQREWSIDHSLSHFEEKESIVLRIRDFGQGIAKSDVPKVFDPFFSKREGGTGLGLSIVRQAMEAHRGTVHIRSEEGLGTTVSLSIPL